MSSDAPQRGPAAAVAGVLQPRGPHAPVSEFQLPMAPATPIRKYGPAGEAVEVCPEPLPSEQDAACGVSIAGGEFLVSPALASGPEHVLEVMLRVARPGAAGARVLVEYAAGQGEAIWQRLGSVELPHDARWQRHRMYLGHLDGREATFRLRRDDSAGGTVYVTLWRICAEHRTGIVNALADYESRLANELQHFAGTAYTHPMYGPAAAGGRGAAVATARTRRFDRRAHLETLAVKAAARLEAMPPEPGEASYNHASRALDALLPAARPDFLGRARQWSSAGPLRVLSLMAGAARTEELMLAHCPGEVDLTLMDASPELVQRAADRLSAAGDKRRVRCLVGDANTGLPGDDEYDLIVCVSALHHVADLETVLSEINRRLRPHGEFWSVGEQVGRNGNRLWPDALDAANAVFSAMPEPLRLNAYSKKVDASIPDRDFSQGCFEGIRSEELRDLLDAYLVPVEVDTRNAFLWRVMDATYCDNFLLDDPLHLHHLRRLVVAEAVHWACGGRGTELNGIYRSKQLR